MRYNKKWFG